MGKLVVAIDGPAGTGKSTVARELAFRLGVPYLDTGAMYRALGLLAIEQKVDPDDSAAAARLAERAGIDLRLGSSGRAEVLVDGAGIESRIRTPEVAAVTSRIAVHPEVRQRMVALQRRLAEQHGGVLEGRDIGTRVLPDTPHKFFLLAAPEIRAERRLGDMKAAGRLELTREEVIEEIRERDERDRSRSASPLMPAPDATIVDTSELDAAAVVDYLLRSIRGGSSVP